MPAARTVPTMTWPMLASWLLFATVPFWIEKVGLYQYLGVEILIFAIYALAFNLVLGHAGLPSFGHGAFFGIGAYAFGLAQFNIAANLWLCLAIAALAAAVGRRPRGALYLAPARHLLRADDHRIWSGLLVHRHQGAQNHRRRGRPAQDRAAAGVAWHRGVRTQEQCGALLLRAGVFIAVSLLLWRLVHSPFGRVVKAIKQNETRARFVGYNVWRYKAAILIVSAGLSGLAGGLFAMAQASAFPDVMSLHYSGYVVMMTLVGGGLVSFWGPVVGAIAFFLARDVIGALTTSWMLWFGLSFVALVLFKPEGIAGIFAGAVNTGTQIRHCARRRRATAGEVSDGACSRRKNCISGSATASCWRTFRWRSRPGSSPASWARTAPARPPASMF